MADSTQDEAVGSVSRTDLLPRSGIGAQGPLLIIAPPGNPIISLDARLLDRIELIGRSPTGAFVLSAAAVGGALAGALQWVPGSLFVCAGMAYLAHDRFFEGRRRSKARDLLLALGDLEVALHVADGADAAKRLADQLTPYTREAPITTPEAYEDARRRLHSSAHGNSVSSNATQSQRGLHVGGEVVRVEEGYLIVGTESFAIDDVRDFALRGANLPLPGGRLLQAAMGLLVVAAEKRARAGEDVDALARRVSDYEGWSGRTAGR